MLESENNETRNTNGAELERNKEYGEVQLNGDERSSNVDSYNREVNKRDTSKEKIVSDNLEHNLQEDNTIMPNP